MMKFTGKPIKIGNSYAVTIPKAYIDNGIISLNKKYWVEMNVLGEDQDVADDSHQA